MIYNALTRISSKYFFLTMKTKTNLIIYHERDVKGGNFRKLIDNGSQISVLLIETNEIEGIRKEVAELRLQFLN